MSADDAKAPLDRGSGEPLSAYISPDDLKDTIDVVYADMAAGDDAAPVVLNDLTDVATAGQAAGAVLRYNGTTWVPATNTVVNVAEVGGAYTRPAGAQCVLFTGAADPGAAAVDGDKWDRL